MEMLSTTYCCVFTSWFFSFGKGKDSHLFRILSGRRCIKLMNKWMNWWIYNILKANIMYILCVGQQIPCNKYYIHFILILLNIGPGRYSWKQLHLKEPAGVSLDCDTKSVHLVVSRLMRVPAQNSDWTVASTRLNAHTMLVISSCTFFNTTVRQFISASKWCIHFTKLTKV